MSVTTAIVIGLTKALRYGIGEGYKTSQRKRQERAALGFVRFDAKGRRDDWPLGPDDNRCRVKESVREDYLDLFGRTGSEGLDAMVDRMKAYLSGKPIERPYGLGPIFLEQRSEEEI